MADILVDQGTADTFLETQLRPDLLETACAATGIALKLNRRAGYGHGYHFVSTFFDGHLDWHAERLFRGPLLPV